MEVAIIGGGASGIMCAVSLRRKSNKINVTVYEKLPRVLKKILVTGNGRCNLTNIYADKTHYRGDIEFIDVAFSKYSAHNNIEFFNSIGLMTRVEDEGRVYPMSSQAASVVNILLAEAERLGVKFVTETEITEIYKRDSKFILNNKYSADVVAVSAGGSAQKAQGTDGASFRLLEKLGLEIKKPTPALTALVLSDFTKSVKGVRNRSTVDLFIDNKKVSSETGEVQFTDYGISGIPVMQLSGQASCSKSENITVNIDSLPDIAENKILEFLLSRKKSNPDETSENVICGILPKLLGNYLMLLCGIKKDMSVGEITENDFCLLSHTIKCCQFKVESVRGFDFAQVTAGGVTKNSVDVRTLEAKNIENLYCTGEAVNIYGLCGGYNLQWAWSSGRLCADSIISKENSLA